MKTLLVYLKNYKKESVLAPLFKMLEAVFDLLVPLVMAAVIDVGIAGEDEAYILKMCAVLIALGLVGLTCAITAQYFAARAAAGFGTGVRHALFSRIQEFSYTQMDTMGTSALITRMTSDVNQVQTGVNIFLRLFLRSPFIVFGAMIMAFTVDRQAAIVFAGLIVLLSVVVFGIMLITMPLYRKAQEALDALLLTTRENIAGVRVLRAFNKQKDEQARFERENGELTRRQNFVGRISALMNPLTYTLVNIGIILLLYVGGVRVNAGSLTQGEVVALINYMLQILTELVKLANLIVTMTKVAACAGRIADVLNMQPDMKNGSAAWGEAAGSSRNEADSAAGGGRNETDASDAGSDTGGALADDMRTEAGGNETDDVPAKDMQESAAAGGVRKGFADAKADAVAAAAQEAPAVEFSHVSLTYRGAAGPALKDISFKVPAGETIGVIGGTGAGKTSLINLIPRFYDATAGTVCIRGRDVRKYDTDNLRAHIGVVPQKSVLFRGTIAQNLRWGNAGAKEDDLLAALKTAQALDFVREKPGGLEFMLESGGLNLSGGQRQRLAIARALVRQPDILILDDSASALDYATDAALRKAIREMKKTPALFIVSQRAASVLQADQIVVLEDGEAAGIGTHSELLETCAVYREIYYSQFPEEERIAGGGQ